MNSLQLLIGTLREYVEGSPLPSVSEVAERRRDPFSILVSTMISLRTKDQVTAAASERLLRRAPAPRDLARMEEKEIAELIFPAGFYNTKAKNLKRMAEQLVSRHAGRVPEGMEQLLELPGVGRKTANLVRNLGYGLDGICVDTHVHRISNRLGWVHTKTPEQTEVALESVLPREYWIPINELLVRFGQMLCTPLSPFCSRCPVRRHCPRIGVERSR
ncbi:MAG: endonuclease III [Spirochaetales bacterium]|nr:endonuclease III [Spirochaetales bacterium]